MSPRTRGWTVDVPHDHQPLPVFHRALADPLVRPVLAQAAHSLRYRLGA